MLGAIIGDIAGSVYEFNPVQTDKFPLFIAQSSYTDDTILTIAVAYSILTGQDYTTSLKYFGRKYDSSYGSQFRAWLHSESNAPYHSWGNGSAMRVSPVGFAFNSVAEVLAEAQKSAEVTHNHPEGVKGAQAIALAIYLARVGKSKEHIKTEISKQFGYNLDRTLAEIRPTYSFDESCQGSVPESILAFTESEDFISAVNHAILLRGDADTMACIAGGIAQAFYKTIPERMITAAKSRLPEEFLKIINDFNNKFNVM